LGACVDVEYFNRLAVSMMNDIQRVDAVPAGPQVQAMCAEFFLLSGIHRTGTRGIHPAVEPLLRRCNREEHRRCPIVDVDQADGGSRLLPACQHPFSAGHDREIFRSHLIADKLHVSARVAAIRPRSASADDQREHERGPQRNSNFHRHADSYNPLSPSRRPVLSPKRSAGSPNLSRSVRYRFDAGVPGGDRWCNGPLSCPPSPPATSSGKFSCEWTLPLLMPEPYTIAA